jgi:hypothetical protein
LFRSLSYLKNPISQSFRHLVFRTLTIQTIRIFIRMHEDCKRRKRDDNDCSHLSPSVCPISESPAGSYLHCFRLDFSGVEAPSWNTIGVKVQWLGKSAWSRSFRRNNGPNILVIAQFIAICRTCYTSQLKRIAQIFLSQSNEGASTDLQNVYFFSFISSLYCYC